MSTPRFTADASLYTSSRTYQGAVSPVRSGAIIQLALDFPWLDNYNRCGCWDAYLDCTYICSYTDPRVGSECMDNCQVSLDNCYSYCSLQRLKLPPGVVGRLGP
jgi:hypothetical protein